MSILQFNGSDTVIQTGNGDLQTIAQALYKEINNQLQENNIALWDYDTGKLIGSNYLSMGWISGIASTKMILDSSVSYLVIGDNPQDSKPGQSLEVYESRPNLAKNLTVLSGREAGLTYIANGESGKIVNTTGKLIFNGQKNTFVEINNRRNYTDQSQNGNWDIMASDDDNLINLTNGYNTIKAGHGNNVITIAQGQDKITLGNGNNNIESDPLHSRGNTTLYVGNGNNNIHLNGDNNYVLVGSGKNNITYDHASQNSYNVITTDDGDNTIKINSGDATVNAGNGNNIVKINSNKENNLTVNVGEGVDTIYTLDSNNIINISGGFTRINAGNGQNTIRTNLGYYYDSSDVKTIMDLGNADNIINNQGNNTIIAGNGTNHIILKAKSSDNAIVMQNNIRIGSGNNNINVDTNVNLVAGDGNNTIKVNSVYSGSTLLSQTNSNIQVGNGNNDIEMTQGHHTLIGGNGNNFIYSDEGEAKISLGDGNNTVRGGYDRIKGNNIFDIGDGDNKVTLLGGSNQITLGKGKNDIDIWGHDNVIHTGTGYNIINLFRDNSLPSLHANKVYTSYTSSNKIKLNTDNNDIFSLGQDTITSSNNVVRQNITLVGGHSEVNVANGFINDMSDHNQIKTTLSSTITGGTDGTIEYSYQVENNQDNNENLLIGGENDTVSALNGANLKAVRGIDNQFDRIDGDLILEDPTGMTSANVKGNVSIRGADGLNLTLKTSGQKQNIFTAGYGNETLDSSMSNANIKVEAYTDQSNPSSLIAVTGSGNDTLMAGAGYATLSGGSGNNLFSFVKENDRNGHTVIADFSSSQGNKIGLFHYGLTQDSLNQLLRNSYNDYDGNAVLNLDNNHTITLQGIDVANLKADQFVITSSKE